MAWWKWVAGGRPAAGKGLLLAALIAALVVSAPRADAAKPLMLGAWLPNGFDSSQIAPFQQMIGRRADIVAVSMPWSGPNGYLGFNVAAAWAYGVSRNGSVPMIGWEPMIGPGGASVYPAPLPGACPGQIASAPANDSVIQYIANFAHQVAAYRSIVLIRMMHEPNYAPPSGGWYWSLGANPWCGNVSESDYIAAWRRVVAIFRYEGATNAKFIWCINWQSWGVPDLVGSYPGDDVVDYTAIDGYNWGGASWLTFDQLFSTPYNAIAWITTRPVLIGEWSSAEQDASGVHSKSSWIQQSFNSIQSGNYPQVAGLLWFEQNVNGQPAWPVSSSYSATYAYAVRAAGVPLPW